MQLDELNGWISRCCSQPKGNQFRLYKYLTLLINGNDVMNGHDGIPNYASEQQKRRLLIN